uniref:2-carboxy-D-arabinitol-1-phosphatase n=1 Tax=Cucumis melo TaxID=3656 RepID=A0A9I9DN93_CUCME
MFSLSLTPAANHLHLLSSAYFPVRIPISSFTIRSSSSIQEVEKSSESSSDRKELSSELYASVPLPPIKTSKRVVLVRHGQSTWNAEGRIQGSSNFSVLTKNGEAQAETSRQMLIDDAFDVCFSRLELTVNLIDVLHILVMIAVVDAANFQIDGHYPVRELWARARNCWDRILAHESRSVLVVAHNAVNQALVATAIGLGSEYFRVLLQSNCGVSVLDFTPHADGGSPIICLNRLNQLFIARDGAMIFSLMQTPNSPVASGSSGGRKATKRIILVCHGVSEDNKASSSFLEDKPMNILGVIQSQKVAELLLDLKVTAVISSPKKACVETAVAISRVQEAADCLGADCVPRYVEMKQTNKLDDVGDINVFEPGWLNKLNDGVITEVWNQSDEAWKSLLNEMADEKEPEKIVVVVGHPAILLGLLGQCLNLTKDWIGSFHLDAGSISVLDFPDGPSRRGVVRCINYTAHMGRWSIPITRPTVDDEEF